MSEFFDDFVKEYNKLAEVNNKKLIKTAEVPEESKEDPWYEEYEGLEQSADENEAFVPAGGPNATETIPIKAAMNHLVEALESLDGADELPSLLKYAAPMREVEESIGNAKNILEKIHAELGKFGE